MNSYPLLLPLLLIMMTMCPESDAQKVDSACADTRDVPDIRSASTDILCTSVDRANSS